MGRHIPTGLVASPGSGRASFPGNDRLDPRLVSRVRPTSDRRDQQLPLLSALTPLFPEGALRRGTVVTVQHTSGARGEGADPGGATTLAFSLLAAASAHRSWCAAVGVGDLGAGAVADIGVDLARLVVVPRPGPRWAEVTAALLPGNDAVLVRTKAAGDGVTRRLAARVRERGVVLVALGRRGDWPDAELRLTVARGSWFGAEEGHGHLRGRRVVVVAEGRRSAARPVRAELWLPGPDGAVTGAVE